MLEAGMIWWIWYVRKSIICQELIRFRKLWTLWIEIFLEFWLSFWKFMINVFIFQILQIHRVYIRMFNEDHKIDLQIEFKFLIREVFFLDVRRYELIKDFEKIRFISFIKILLNLEQHCLRRSLLLSLTLGWLHTWFTSFICCTCLRCSWGTFCDFILH